MAAPRYKYAACLCWGGDIQTGELEVEVSFSVDWGSLEVPDCPFDPISVEDIVVDKIEGQPAADFVRGEYMPGHTIESIIDKLKMDHEDRMITEALEAEEARRPD